MRPDDRIRAHGVAQFANAAAGVCQMHPVQPQPFDHQHMIGNHQRNVAGMGQFAQRVARTQNGVCVLRGHMQAQAGHILRIQNAGQLRRENCPDRNWGGVTR